MWLVYMPYLRSTWSSLWPLDNTQSWLYITCISQICGLWKRVQCEIATRALQDSHDRTGMIWKWPFHWSTIHDVATRVMRDSYMAIPRYRIYVPPYKTMPYLWDMCALPWHSLGRYLAYQGNGTEAIGSHINSTTVNRLQIQHGPAYTSTQKDNKRT